VEPIFLDDQIENITQSLTKIMTDVPCLKFLEVAENFQGSHLIFTAMGGPQCFSNVGRVGTKGQQVNLGSPECLSIGTILHETLHGLGAVHEHSRSDRNSYVSILLGNVQPGMEDNFQIVSTDTHSSRGTPFDTNSIMMYGPDDFGIEDSQGKRRTTIQPLDSKVEIRGAGSKTELSLVDKIELARAYQPLTGSTCFLTDTVLEYAEYLESQRRLPCSCPSCGTTTIVLSSTAGAARYQGSSLGEFTMAGVHGGRPYYKQKDTEGNPDLFLFSSCDLLQIVNCDWLVGPTLGGNIASLVNYQSSPLPPVNNWYYRMHGEWIGDDLSLTLEFTTLSPCQLVRVEGKGGVVRAQSSSLGDYRLEMGRWSCGRPVFRKVGKDPKFLLVPSDWPGWSIKNSTTDTTGFIATKRSWVNNSPSSPSSPELKWCYHRPGGMSCPTGDNISVTCPWA